jgi:Tetratricopeptide repeat
MEAAKVWSWANKLKVTQPNVPEELRTFQEFYPDVRRRLGLHYSFVFQFLSSCFHQDPDAFIANLPGRHRSAGAWEPNRFIQSRWSLFENLIPEARIDHDPSKECAVFHRVSDLSMTIHEETGDWVGLIQMPKPEVPIRAIFVAITGSRMFTLESTFGSGPQGMAEIRPDAAPVCEAIKGGGHASFGIAIEPKKGPFLQAVTALLRYEPTQSAAAPSTPGPEALLRQGMALLNDQRLAEAVALFDRALELRPNYGEVCFRKGLALVSLQRYSDAVVALEKALHLGQKEAKSHYLYWWRKLHLRK